LPPRDRGERAFIARWVRPVEDERVLVGPGDDAALVRPLAGAEILTVDALVEGQHFDFDLFTPAQVGRKAVEVNVSDIAAMGGEPRYALLSLSFPAHAPEERVEGIYAGIYQAAERYGIRVVGGNLARSPLFVLSLTLTGEVDPARAATRSGARPGDEIRVSGPLGGARAGFLLLRHGQDGFESVKRRHLEPTARLDLGRALAPVVSAMEDLSDGLSTDLHNLCEASGCGAVIDAERIPVADEVRDAARLLQEDPTTLAVQGGEDYELLYAVAPERAAGLPGFRIGEVVAGHGVRLRRGGREEPLPRGGWDPFA
jgi:thiamine-monophosphate kinase